MKKRNIGRNKIIRDLWLYKSRTLLVLIAVIIGVGSFGMMYTGRTVLQRVYLDTYIETNPAHAVITMQDFDPEIVAEIAALNDVAAVEGRRRIYSKIGDESGNWFSVVLFAVDDLKTLQIGQPHWLEQTPFNPGKDGVLFDHEIDALASAPVGAQAKLRTILGDGVTLKTVGYVNEIILPTTKSTRMGVGYMSLDSAETFGEPAQFNELHIITAEQHNNLAEIEKRVSNVIEYLEADGYTIYSNDIPTPGVNPLSNVVDSVMVVLQATGILIMLLSIIVVGNVMSALMAQQKGQIAILKSLGTTRWGVARVYLNMVLIIGTIALIVAIPQGYGGAYATVSSSMSQVDYPMRSFGIPMSTLLSQIALAYLVPLVAVLGPIIISSRISIREALGDTQADMGGGLGTLLKRGSLLLRGTVRNTFRRKGRLILTFVTLSVGGAIFIAVFGLSSALSTDFANLLNHSNFDVSVDLAQPVDREQLEQLALEVDGVELAEGWLTASVSRVNDNAVQTSSAPVFAVPTDSKLADPLLIHGDWFDSGEDASVIMSAEAIERMGLAANSEADLTEPFSVKIGRNETTVTQAGAMGSLFAPLGYMRYQDVAELTGLDGFATRLVVQTAQGDLAFQGKVEQALLEKLADENIFALQSAPQQEARKGLLTAAATVTGILLSSVIIVVLVGGIGLSSTLGINVLERTREIGILRSIGTTNKMLSRMVVGEGVVTSLLSVPIAILLSVPINRAIGLELGNSFVGQPLTYFFSWNSVLAWVVIILLLTLIASITPVRSAQRLTIREALAYTG